MWTAEYNQPKQVPTYTQHACESRGYCEFINYPGSFFFVKALVTPPIPSCLPNRVCFHPKMVCFSFFSFFVSQDLHATSRLVLRHTICVLCSCVLYTPPHIPVGLQMDSTYNTIKATYFMVIHLESIWSLHRLCLDSTRFQMAYTHFRLSQGI